MDEEVTLNPDGSGKLTVEVVFQDINLNLSGETEQEEGPIKIKIDFSPGDLVKIREGTFESFEGSIEGIDDASGKISVLIEIFGRSTPVELEYWQVEAV